MVFYFVDSGEYEYSLGYKFSNPHYLKEALTHSSFDWRPDETYRIDNEKLEFIGDAYLDAIVGTEIYKRMPAESKEGDLTRIRAQIVCERSLAIVGKSLDIGYHLRMGPGEEKTGGREKDSLIADAVEAIIGAIYMDGGFEAAYKFVFGKFNDLIQEAIEGGLILDYKTGLQEWAQKKGAAIKYIVDRMEGPDHDKTFYIHLEINGKEVSKGIGKNKKEAQQMAAEEVIKRGLDNVL